jgi:hypothetical protein
MGKTQQQRLDKGNVQVNQNNNTNGTTANTLQLTSDAVGSSSVEGEPVTFTATVMENDAATPSGTVTFLSGSTVLGYGVISGNKVIFKTSILTLGINSVWAYYSGDNRFAASSTELSPLTHTVIKKTGEPKAEKPETTDPVKNPKPAKGKSANQRSNESEEEKEDQNNQNTSEVQTETAFGGEGFRITAYPNPGTGRYIIAVEGFEEGGLEIGVYSVQGQKLNTSSAEYNRKNRSFELDITNQPAGFYLVEVRQGNFRAMARLIKL